MRARYWRSNPEFVKNVLFYRPGIHGERYDGRDPKSRVAKLLAALQSSDTDRAAAIIKSASNLIDSELYACALVMSPNTISNVQTLALESFAARHGNTKDEHIEWVHSMSHLSFELWDNRLTTWLRKYYGIAFQNARKFMDWSHCERLIFQFALFALYTDNPIKYHMTRDNLLRFDWELVPALIRQRIEMGSFTSEIAYVDWRIEFLKILLEYRNQIEPQVLEETCHAISQMAHKGIDVRNRMGELESILTDHVRYLAREFKPPANDSMNVEIHFVQHMLAWLSSEKWRLEKDIDATTQREE